RVARSSRSSKDETDRRARSRSGSGRAGSESQAPKTCIVWRSWEGCGLATSTARVSRFEWWLQAEGPTNAATQADQEGQRQAQEGQRQAQLRRGGRAGAGDAVPLGVRRLAQDGAACS